MSDLLLIGFDVFLTIRGGGTPGAQAHTVCRFILRSCGPAPYPKKDRPPHAELLRNSDSGSTSGQKAAWLRSHAPAARTKLAVLAGPTEVGVKAFAVDRLKNLLNPSGQTTIVLRCLIEVDLLEGRRFRFDENVVPDQCLDTRRAETELVHGIGINQP